MTKQMEELLNKAEVAKLAYHAGQLTREEAQEDIMPYINQFNEKAKTIARKYNKTPRRLTFAEYVR